MYGGVVHGVVLKWNEREMSDEWRLTSDELPSLRRTHSSDFSSLVSCHSSL